MDKPVYLDNAASAPLDPRLLPLLNEALARPGNPSALHAAGRLLRAEIDDARGSVAALIGAAPEDIVFTSGASESNNTAVRGLFAAAAAAAPGRTCRVLISPLEHPSAAEAARLLAAERGAAVDVLPVDRQGLVSAADVARLITDDTVLVCVMWVNNVLGSVQPIAEIGRIVAAARRSRPAGSPPLHFFCDAVQAAAWLPIDVRAAGVDALSLSAHKLGGPKGVGALYLRRGAPCEPLLVGGGQEEGRRSGTENHAGIVALGAAAALAAKEGPAEAERLRGLRRRLVDGLAALKGFTVIGPAGEQAAPHIVYFRSDRFDGETLVLKLDAAGIAVSSGSACDAGSRKTSSVLKAVLGDGQAARGGVRVSFGRTTTEADIERLLRPWRHSDDILHMKKVFIVHGFEGSPNGGWRPWLMGELAKHEIYACALSMPSPEAPKLAEWLAEISRHVDRNAQDELYLVGHSLGVPSILRYLETAPSALGLAGAVLVSGPCEPTGNAKLGEFLDEPFDLAAIKPKLGRCVVVHGDNDPLVPLAQAEKLSRELGAKLVIIKNGGHLNGSSGWYTLPAALDALLAMAA